LKPKRPNSACANSKDLFIFRAIIPEFGKGLLPPIQSQMCFSLGISKWVAGTLENPSNLIELEFGINNSELSKSQFSDSPLFCLIDVQNGGL
jgi:hypothetical protein